MEITEGKELPPFTATTKAYSTNEEMNDAIVKLFKSKGQVQPFLLFDDSSDETLWKSLVAYGSEAHVNTTRCDTFKDAKLFKGALAQMDTGIIRMDNRFSVGIDIKLA